MKGQIIGNSRPFSQNSFFSFIETMHNAPKDSSVVAPTISFYIRKSKIPQKVLLKLFWHAIVIEDFAHFSIAHFSIDLLLYIMRAPRFLYTPCELPTPTVSVSSPSPFS